MGDGEKPVTPTVDDGILHSRPTGTACCREIRLVPSQPSTDGSNRATPPDSTHQFRLGPPLGAGYGRYCRKEVTEKSGHTDAASSHDNAGR
ncbi:hypothetical protein CYV19_00250 [Natronobacterium gregoryi SP2]|uniref:Uncharacterized protein n=1 Tax=Natronobacterium gregoryi (strain ATCC 43098 / DSM 3393 / CCM 3738 / CIP 104747 / IAM 13177 / JCM 8860 / NBRC 102187 / NCIMB 2189 / SP2) TaxID=797304 RepID=A0A2J4JJQ0_NATGS|nr:hypothetical protein CYV19_00250 [Natronobacterium gregoryi SP2]